MIFTDKGSYGLKDSRLEARRQKQRHFLGFFLKALFWLILLGGAYLLGGKGEAMKNERLIQNLEAEKKKYPEMRQDLEALRIDFDKMKAEKNTLLEKYSKETPQGDLKGLFALLKSRLKEGIAPERLNHVLAHTQNESKCDARPFMKKMLVETPLQKNVDSLVFFNDNIQVSAKGQTTKNARGLKEAWFNPLEPLTLSVKDLSRKNAQAKVFTSTLPMHHRVVMNNQEYRFTLSNGPRGYVQVSALRCDFP